MMEKDFNSQELNKLIGKWTDELLPADIDDRITDSLLDFVKNDDAETDVEDILNLHIHELAMEETTAKRRKWRIFVSSVAAASVVLIAVAATFIFTRDNEHHTGTETVAVENSCEATTTSTDRHLPATMAEASDGKTDHSSRVQELRRVKKSAGSGYSAIAKTPKNGYATITHEERAMKQQEDTPELILIETLAELNEGLDNMADNTTESLRMTNASLLPANLMSDDNETDIIENTLINTLYEIRNLNIDLNFETDNTPTDI